MKDFNLKKYRQNGSYENLDTFPLISLFFFIDIAFIGGSTPSTAFDGAINKVDTLNIYMKEFSKRKYNFWQNDIYDNLDNYTLICIHSAYTGQSSSTGFDGAIWYFAYTM